MSSLRRASLTVVAVVAATLVQPVSAASADDPYDIPPSATITLRGDGFGHGVGMSQYGAYGAARKSLGAKKVLRFYYPGTTLGDAGGKVEVLISGDDDQDLVVDDRARLSVRSLKSGKSFRLDEPKATRWRIRPVGTRSEISYRTRHWHVWRVLKGDAEISAGGRPVTLRTPDGSGAYRGALRSTRSAAGTRITVNVVPMEAYVRGVVTREMRADWPQQALRAQAVASRTYAAYERAHTHRVAYDLCDTSACQVYGGVAGETSSGDDAVQATAHRVLTHAGEVAYAQFSASNGGWTVADDRFPYLVAKEDPYEGTSPDYYGWTVQLTSEEVEKAYNLGNLTYLGIETRGGDGTGHVATIRIRTEGGFDGTVTGESFFRHFDLRSTMFRIADVS
ncbi:SpoIID/LytB domain-containing protein [Nocardioides sp. MAHUQ-72]|uniref:SpoIID/LytB domain-containing protein n=1 Tax=unclassified Nocardioides TaxID=2615069 RepID=UPI00361760BE